MTLGPRLMTWIFRRYVFERLPKILTRRYGFLVEVSVRLIVTLVARWSIRRSMDGRMLLCRR